MTGGEILSWLKENSGAANAALNALMVLIWLIYLQIFLASFLRQRRPSILITRGGAEGLEARCVIGNMSMEPIYVLSLIAQLHAEDGSVATQITDLKRSAPDKDLPLSEVTRQGPLDSGAYMGAGDFTDILRRLRPEMDLARLIDGRRPPRLEIIVMAVHGSDDLIVGARRSYRLERRGGEVALLPVRLETTQIRSRFRRRLLRRRWKPYLMA